MCVQSLYLELHHVMKECEKGNKLAVLNAQIKRTVYGFGYELYRIRITLIFCRLWGSKSIIDG